MSALSEHADEWVTAPSPSAREATFDRTAILALLDQLITEVVGEDYDLGETLDPTMSFSDDLELESLEFIRLGELLHDIYGDKVDFVAWFSDLDVDAIIDLTVEDLITFIEGCR